MLAAVAQDGKIDWDQTVSPSRAMAGQWCLQLMTRPKSSPLLSEVLFISWWHLWQSSVISWTAEQPRELANPKHNVQINYSARPQVLPTGLEFPMSNSLSWYSLPRATAQTGRQINLNAKYLSLEQYADRSSSKFQKLTGRVPRCLLNLKLYPLSFRTLGQPNAFWDRARTGIFC